MLIACRATSVQKKASFLGTAQKMKTERLQQGSPIPCFRHKCLCLETSVVQLKSDGQNVPEKKLPPIHSRHPPLYPQAIENNFANESGINADKRPCCFLFDGVRTWACFRREIDWQKSRKVHWTDFFGCLVGSKASLWFGCIAFNNTCKCTRVKCAPHWYWSQARLSWKPYTALACNVCNAIDENICRMAPASLIIIIWNDLRSGGLFLPVVISPKFKW